MSNKILDTWVLRELAAEVMKPVSKTTDYKEAEAIVELFKPGLDKLLEEGKELRRWHQAWVNWYFGTK